MQQWRVIYSILFLLQTTSMGCTAFKQYHNPRNINNDKRMQRNNLSKMTYFYPKIENYRGLLNSRAVPTSKNWEDNLKRSQISGYKQSQDLQPNRQHNSLNSGVFVPKLPNHYVNLNGIKLLQNRRSVHNFRPNTNFRVRNLPIFEQDEEGQHISIPRTAGRGSKAKLIFNSPMGAKKKFPMMEPTPGDILYPPNTPKFKVTPLNSEIIRSNSWSPIINRRENQRMIPFYAHEAILPSSERLTTTTMTTTMKPYYSHFPYEDYKYSAPISTTSTPFPQIVYAIPYPIYPESRNFTSHESFQSELNEKMHSSATNNYKTYRAYWNKDDISIKPVYENQFDVVMTTTPTTVPKKYTQLELNDQILPPKYFHNHRMEVTTPLTNFIISTTRPSLSTTENAISSELLPAQNQHMNKKILSSMRGGFKSSYPLHVYTLSKLMQKKQEKLSTDYDSPAESTYSSQDRELFSNNFLDSKELIEDNKAYFDEILKETPKRARQATSDLDSVSVQPNVNWIMMDQEFHQDLDVPQKFSSHYKEAIFNPLSRKSIPKIHESAAVLGAQILVQR